MKKHFRKRYIIGIFVCILLLLILLFLIGKPKSGSYVLLVNDSNHLMYQGIRLNMEDRTFELIGNPLDSQSAYTGTFEIEGDRLVATDVDSEVVYVFNIVNRIVLKFNREESVGWQSTVTGNNVSGVVVEAYYIYVSDFLGEIFY